MTTAAIKIVIVAGQEFSVPADTPDETIRSTLAGQGFADVAGAEIKRGTRTVGEEQVPTIEFVKKAGTKGADAPGRALVALLDRVPPEPTGRPAIAGLTPRQSAVLARLRAEQLTCDEAAAPEVGEALANAENAARPSYAQRTPINPGGALCQACDQLPAAAAAPSGW